MKNKKFLFSWLFQNRKVNKILNSDRGVTLVEVTVAIFIIAVFSLIAISDFPKIKRNFALSRVGYKLAQDIRRAEDLGLSGAEVVEGVNTKGYGFYINLNTSDEQYLIYADTNDPADTEYTESEDYIIETINIFESEPDVYIKKIYDIDDPNAMITYLSINFNPPNPDVTITADSEIVENGVGIVMSLEKDQSTTRTIFINSSGLIDID